MKTRIKTGTKYAILIVLILTLIIPIINALDFNPVSSQNAKEGVLLEFSTTITNPNGTVNFTRTPNIGTITKISNTEAKFSWTPSIGDAGIYTLQVTAQDDSDIKTKNITINVTANNPPQIISTSGGGLVNTDKIIIGAVTDKSSTCKYSLESKSYSAMEYTMAALNSQKTEHEGLTPTLTQGNHIIYILCKDEQGNFMITPEEIQIESNLKPTASITLSPNPPLRGGTVSIVLSTSEDLISAPKLEYMFSDDSKLIPVALEGSGKYWSGYMVIQDTKTERVGNFIFKGYDMTNLEGTEITSGKIFLVDSGLPDTVQSIEARSDSDRIKLVWHYTDTETDNIKEYNIYRKKGVGGVDYVDYYDTTDNEYYYDDNVDYNEAYYYRIAAVDEAENKGALSKEVFITHKPITAEEETTKQTTQELEKKLQYALDIELQKIEKIKLDVAQAEQNLGKVLGADNLEVIETLGLLREIKAISNKVDNLKTEMEGLRTKTLSQTAFESAVNRINAEANAEWKKTPTGIEITDSTTYKEFVEDTKTEEIMNDYIKEKYPDAKLPEKTVELTKKLQDLLIVDVTLIKSEVIYPDETKQFSIVKKNINVENSPSQILIIEKIPEKIYGDLSRIIFNKQPSTIQKYNIAYWNYDSIEKGKIVYSIPENVDLADLKSVKTILFSEPEEEKSNLITGLAPSENSGTGGPNILFILIIAGIAVIFGLFAYYIFSSEEETEEGHKKRFLPAKNLFKKKNENHLKIIPDEHKRLDLEVERKERTTPSIQIITHEHPVFERKTEEPENSDDDLDSLHNKLKEYKENIENVKDLDEIDAMREKTLKIRALCDEIEEKNIQAYTKKTKEYLEKTLSYLNKRLDKKEDEIKVEEKPALLSKNAPQGKYFKLSDGREIRTVEELSHMFTLMDESTFKSHVNESKNDFSNWIRDVFEEPELAHKIRNCKTKEEMKKTLFS